MKYIAFSLVAATYVLAFCLGKLDSSATPPKITYSIEVPQLWENGEVADHFIRGMELSGNCRIDPGTGGLIYFEFDSFESDDTGTECVLRPLERKP